MSFSISISGWSPLSTKLVNRDNLRVTLPFVMLCCLRIPCAAPAIESLSMSSMTPGGVIGEVYRDTYQTSDLAGDGINISNGTSLVEVYRDSFKRQVW